MSIPAENLAELRVSQLEMVQANIGRIAGYGATIKNWCITVVTAICGVSIHGSHGGLVWLALLPIVIFALMDAEYLRVERQFRNAFDRIRHEDWSTLPSFDASPDSASKSPLVAALCSWSVLSFYVPLALGVIIVRLVEGVV